VTATLPRPGYSTSVLSSPFPSTLITATGTWFAAGICEKGPLKPLKVESLSDFVNKFGSRVSYGMMYDAMDEFFSDGGALAYVGRVVGPAAVVASHTLEDASAGESFKAEALGPGEYANTTKVKVTTVSSKFTIEVLVGSVVVEVSPSFETQAEAIAWAALSSYIVLKLGASSLIPKTQEVTLTGGADNRGSITGTQWKAGLELFGKSLGPGQVSMPGQTTQENYITQLEHALNYNRFALLDGPQSGTASTVSAAATALRDTAGRDTYGMMFAPWVTIPGVLPGTVRQIPPSALVAAKIASSDGEGKSPNRPAAATNGKSIRAIGLEQKPFNSGSGEEVTRDEMYTNGVNIIREDGGVIEVYGWRVLTNPNGTFQDWLNAGNARLRMAIVAKANAIAKRFVLDEIDGAGKVLKEFEGELKAMLGEYYRMGSLFGATPEEAFSVNVGPSVNTPETLHNLEMKAAIALRMSPDAEMVVIVISKVPITQPLP